jgi:translation initiation factor IF-1
MSENSIVEGTVTEQISSVLYEVICFDGRRIVASIGKNLIHGVQLSIGAKVFVYLLPNRTNSDGKILTASDFKVNNWDGWSDQHEPKL